MKRIPFFKYNTVEELRRNVRQNLAWYREKENSTLNNLLENYGEMNKKADFSCLKTLKRTAQIKDEVENVVSVYESLQCLSLQQAADERIWTFLTHITAKDYVSERWNNIPEDDKKAEKYILDHYFTSSARGLIRGNAIARLWWMGYIASRFQANELKKTLNILMEKSDVRANLLERPSLSMSREVFNGIIRLLGTEKEKNEIYDRENFRSVMKVLNQKGGRIMLNMLDEKQVDELFENIKKETVNTYKYEFKVGTKTVDYGITTKEIQSLEKELKKKWKEGKINQVGVRTTREVALQWKQRKKRSKETDS